MKKMFLISAIMLLLIAMVISGCGDQVGKATTTTKGSLDVKKVTPANTTVLVDGVNKNYKTPIIIANLAAGKHTITFQKSGYVTQTVPITISANKISYIQISLKPLSTPIPTRTPVSTATSTPIPTRTPVSTATSTPIPTRTPVSTATSTPVSQFGSLDVRNVTPSGVRVIIDLNNRTNYFTPMIIGNISVGTHSAAFLKENYTPQVRNFNITAGQITRIVLNLQHR